MPPVPHEKKREKKRRLDNTVGGTNTVQKEWDNGVTGNPKNFGVKKKKKKKNV